MTGSEPPRRGGVVPPILWKIIFPTVSGGAVYLITSLTHQPQEWALMLSAFVSGVLLVVQFLIDFDRSLRDIEKRLATHMTEMDDTVRAAFLKINTATATYSTIETSPVGADIEQLVKYATGLKDSFPKVALLLAQSEIMRVASLIRELGEGQATYYGEDQDWLLTLVDKASATIDATSTTAVDGGGTSFEDGFWTTALGQRYLGVQRDAASRGVRIRRLFILSSPARANDAEFQKPEFQKLYRMQIEAHVTVRVLESSKIPERLINSQFDFILFDSIISYETDAATRLDFGMKPRIVKTQLVTRPHHVQGRHALFEELWKLAAHLTDANEPIVGAETG